MSALFLFMLVIPAHAGIQRLCFLFCIVIPDNVEKMECRNISISSALDSGMRRNDEQRQHHSLGTIPPSVGIPYSAPASPRPGTLAGAVKNAIVPRLETVIINPSYRSEA